MNREEKIKKIYEVIADKTISDGLIFNHDGVNFTRCEICQNKIYEGDDLIGHPVMIGDVLDWIEKQPEEREGICMGGVLSRWKEKRKPIDSQEDSCIDFIFSLLA